MQPRTVLLQAGAFGEHEFVEARLEGAEEIAGPPVVVHSRHLLVRLGPSAQVRLHLGLRRFAHRPTYEFTLVG